MTMMLLVVGCLCTTAAADGWHDLDGKAAPEITAARWLHVPGGSASRAALEGKVWLLNFMGIH